MLIGGDRRGVGLRAGNRMQDVAGHFRQTVRSLRLALAELLYGDGLIRQTAHESGYGEAQAGGVMFFRRVVVMLLRSHGDQRHAEPVRMKRVPQTVNFVVGDEFKMIDIARWPRHIAGLDRDIPRLAFDLHADGLAGTELSLLFQGAKLGFQAGVVEIAGATELRVVAILCLRELWIEQICVGIDHAAAVQIKRILRFSFGFGFDAANVRQLGCGGDGFGRRFPIDDVLHLGDELRRIDAKLTFQIVATQEHSGPLGGLRAAAREQHQPIGERIMRRLSQRDPLRRGAAGQQKQRGR